MPRLKAEGVHFPMTLIGLSSLSIFGNTSLIPGGTGAEEEPLIGETLGRMQRRQPSISFPSMVPPFPQIPALRLARQASQGSSKPFVSLWCVIAATASVGAG